MCHDRVAAVQAALVPDVVRRHARPRTVWPLPVKRRDGATNIGARDGPRRVSVELVREVVAAVVAACAQIRPTTAKKFQMGKQITTFTPYRHQNFQPNVNIRMQKT